MKKTIKRPELEKKCEFLKLSNNVVASINISKIKSIIKTWEEVKNNFHKSISQIAKKISFTSINGGKQPKTPPTKIKFKSSTVIKI